MFFKQTVLLLFLLITVFIPVIVVWELVFFLFKKNKSAMYVASFNRHIQLMKDSLDLTSWKRLVDLWCGDGKAMRFFAKEFGLQCDGYEFQRFPYYYGKLINYLLWYKTLHLYRKDFSQVDFSRYDYIYTYLLPNQMAEIEPWIFKNMKPDSIIISNSFQFAVHKPYETIKNKHGKPSIFLYKK